MTGKRVGMLTAGLVLAGGLVLGTGAVLAGQPGSGWMGWSTSGMMEGGGMNHGGSTMHGSGATYGSGSTPGGMMHGGGMTHGGGMMPGTISPGPGDTGFVAGTTQAPRVVQIAALPSLRFTPDTVRVQAGETIQFQVTAMGPFVHEFMVGPAAGVAADVAGTPEVADIGMMQTASLTYTFSGPGPFAFACHAPGHYEAGMAGTIVVVD